MPCADVDWDEANLSCRKLPEQINPTTKGIAFMITAVIELVLVFACYMCGKSSMDQDEAKEEAERQHMISQNYQVPN